MEVRRSVAAGFEANELLTLVTANINDLRRTEALNGTEVYVLADDPGARIRQVFENEAQNDGIVYPDYVLNFDQCELRAAMCCWVRDRQANDNNGNCADDNCVDADPADNVDICFSDMERFPSAPQVNGGFAVYENGEGASHCHGFAWGSDENELMARYKGNNLFFVSLYDHLTQRGYVDPVPGSPMCACVEKMPTVTRSDCTQMNIEQTATFSFVAGDVSVVLDPTVSVQFQACQASRNNDLAAYYQRMVEEGRATAEEKAIFDSYIVGNGNCAGAITSFMATKGFVETA